MTNVLILAVHCMQEFHQCLSNFEHYQTKDIAYNTKRFYVHVWLVCFTHLNKFDTDL